VRLKARPFKPTATVSVFPQLLEAYDTGGNRTRTGMNMEFERTVLLILVLMTASILAGAQQSTGSAEQSNPSADSNTTIHGCLSRSRGNYILIEDKTGLVYALKGVGNKLAAQLGHEVSATGTLQPGTMKTGVRSAKEGSNPADTIHGVDGLLFKWRTCTAMCKPFPRIAKLPTPSDNLAECPAIRK
jgi:hypothetical protein